MYKNNQKGTVFNIQRFSLHDGPGVRTIVFLKGCAMSCLWCSNPESQYKEVQVLFNKQFCIECGKCKAVCEAGAIDLKSEYRIIREKCTACGACVEVCPTDALVSTGKEVSSEEIMTEIKKDMIHYRRSNGGITFSGGEPLLQPEFVEDMIRKCKQVGLHTAMETALYADEKSVREIIPKLDLLLMDIKCIDSLNHREFTGVNNDLILKNAKLANELAKEIIVRVPVIQGFNCNEKSIREIAEFVKPLDKVSEIHLLPYHNYGESKYKAIGKNYKMKDALPPDKMRMINLGKVIEEVGLNCRICF